MTKAPKGKAEVPARLSLGRSGPRGDGDRGLSDPLGHEEHQVIFAMI